MEADRQDLHLSAASCAAGQVGPGEERRGHWMRIQAWIREEHRDPERWGLSGGEKREVSARSEWRAGDTKLVLFINSTPQGPSPLVNSILNYFSPLFFFFFLVFNLCV